MKCVMTPDRLVHIVHNILGLNYTKRQEYWDVYCKTHRDFFYVKTCCEQTLNDIAELPDDATVNTRWTQSVPPVTYIHSLHCKESGMRFIKTKDGLVHLVPGNLCLDFYVPMYWSTVCNKDMSLPMAPYNPCLVRGMLTLEPVTCLACVAGDLC